MTDEAKTCCETCDHFLMRDWQKTHGTCEWADSPRVKPFWISGQWPTLRKNDGENCEAWEEAP